MLHSGDLLSNTPTHVLFDCEIASPDLESWLSIQPKTVIAVSIGCGSPSPVELHDISALVKRTTHYIGFDNDAKLIDRARDAASFYEKKAPFPLTATFEVHDLSKSLPSKKQQIAHIVLFNTPDVLGTQQKDYSGQPHVLWKSITKYGLEALKSGGLVIATTITKTEFDHMRGYLVEFGVNIIVDTQAPRDVAHFGHHGVLLGIKS